MKKFAFGVNWYCGMKQAIEKYKKSNTSLSP
jgi:hypothetical protein